MTGHKLVLELKSPDDCSREERDHFRVIVVEAGEVEETGLDNRIARAKVLAFMWLGTATIGVGGRGATNFPSPINNGRFFSGRQLKAGSVDRLGQPAAMSGF